MLASTTLRDRSFDLQLFLCLQALDVFTTWVGFHVGLAEASPFIRALMHWGPFAGLLASKILAAALGGYCVWRNRYRVIGIINCWYAILVIWNLTLIASR